MKPMLRQVLDRMAPRIGLTPEAIDLLVTGSQTALVRAERPLSPGGHATDVVILVLEGAGRVEYAAGGAHTVIVQLVPPGQFVRVPTGRGSSPRTPVLHAVAHVDSWVAVIGTPVLAGVLARLPADRLLRLMAYSWRALSRHLFDRCRMPLLRLGDRLLLELGTLAHDFGQPIAGGIRIDVRVTHAQLANLVGGSRAAVCRELAELVGRGRLAVLGRYFVLPDGSVPASATLRS
jgi:CRP-like cAMP-binding protein